ncbi:GntR family transcriptional regulator [Sporosarcina sp. P12(2017)]|uniref:GntR family transcriptional regulator n=1 Tax=unclassified Sporosarcina TaxID=2647733 RepID=UPI000C16A5E8|nr:MULTISPECIES: GntR family transcriptional regulator [unclassified Sporosarcina]PIC57070.1 GntR family transcriptional regulator [Sporosarcina sp. P10]PIC60452.1 GntR family transcriptional regulator [Sporosarcina sp. P12(2017)]
MNKDLSKFSLKHRIAQEIRNLIYEGKLVPGEKITENRLSQNLGVSRTSIREAILLLELEGLLISSPYKDTRVATISQEEVVELLLPMRVRIETYALKKGFENWGEKYKETIRRIVEDMRKAANYDDLLTFIELDIQLHELIVTASEMENVIRIWESIVHRIRLHFVYQNSKSGTLEKWLKEHEELVDILITAEDINVAAEALQKHIIDTNIPDVYLLN